MRYDNLGIDPDYDFLYDPQQAEVYGFCEKFGREIYSPGFDLCIDCREENE